MSSWGHFAPNSGKCKSAGDVAIRACKTYQLGGVPGRAAVPRWLGLLSAVCLLACITTTFAQSPGSQISIYAVEGLALGAHIPFDSSAYREYKCSPSDQFDGFTWCQQTRQQGERRRSSDVTYSLLHSRDGSIVYINRYQTPAFFGRNEAEHDIQSYSQKLGESPRTKDTDAAPTRT